MIRWIVNTALVIPNILNYPLRVLGLCLTFCFFSLVIQGSLFNLYSLKSDHKELKTKITQLEWQTQKLKMKVSQVKDPKFLELEARNEFNLVNPGDLVFIFSDDENSNKETL